MIKKMIYTAIVFILIISSVVLTACNDSDEEWRDIPFTVAYQQMESDANVLRSFKSVAEKVESREDLIELSNKKGYPFFNQNHSLYNHEASVKIRSYSESYFRDNELILVFYHDFFINSTKIDTVKVKNDTLKVVIDRKETKNVDEHLSIWIFLIEVDEDDVDDIDEVGMMEVND